MEAKEFIKNMRIWLLNNKRHCEDMLRTQSGEPPEHVAFYDGQIVAYCDVLEYLYSAMKEISKTEIERW